MANIALPSGGTNIITIFNQKGGVGKTTTTCQLAGTFGHRGYDVLVADLDGQQSARAWLTAKGGKNFPGQLWVGSGYGENTIAELSKLSPKYDLIFVDCAPAVDQPGTWASLLVSQLAIVPTKMGPSDTEALPKALELAKKAIQTTGVPFPVRVLATAYRKNRADDVSAYELLKKHSLYPEFKMFDTVLSDRVVFQRSMLVGATVHSLGGAKEAIEEIDALADEVAKLMKIPAVKKGKV